MLLSELCFLLSLLATPILGAAITTTVPGFVGHELSHSERANEPVHDRDNHVPTSDSDIAARQAVLPVNGRWIWGGGSDQCDGDNNVKHATPNALIKDCEWLRDYLVRIPGFYEAFEWEKGEQAALMVYYTCTFSARLQDDSRDLIRFGSSNVADLLSYALDPENDSRSGVYVALTGDVRCYAEYTSDANLQWIIHGTNEAPFDNATVVTQPDDFMPPNTSGKRAEVVWSPTSEQNSQTLCKVDQAAMKKAGQLATVADCEAALDISKTSPGCWEGDSWDQGYGQLWSWKTCEFRVTRLDSSTGPIRFCNGDIAQALEHALDKKNGYIVEESVGGRGQSTCDGQGQGNIAGGLLGWSIGLDGGQYHI